MAVYLDECQAGCDADVIGFPHVLLCMAVVLQTNGYLWGFHFDSPPRNAEYADALLDFIQRKGGNVGNGVRLYGCCHHGNRNTQRHPATGDAHANWRAEMTQIAGRLGYHGPVTGFDTAIIDPRQGTYIEFQRVAGSSKCRIFYKRHEKMQHAVQMIAPQHATPPGTGKVNTWRAAQPVYQRPGQWISDRARTTGAALAGGATKLHELNYFMRATSFDV